MELTPLNPQERSRTYTFPNGETVTLNDVTHFAAGETTHRLKTADGKIHIVPKSGWLHIAIDADKFTV
jgi:hypothetical protein